MEVQTCLGALAQDARSSKAVPAHAIASRVASAFDGPSASGVGPAVEDCVKNQRILRRTVNTAPNIASIKPAAPVIGSKLAVRGSTRVGAG